LRGTDLCYSAKVLLFSVLGVTFIHKLQRVHLVEMICEHVLAHQRQNLSMRYVICYVPRSNILCEKVFLYSLCHFFAFLGQVLVEYQLSRKIQVTELALDLIPIENDVLSMEMVGEHRECKLV
jgi:hypothetical protein